MVDKYFRDPSDTAAVQAFRYVLAGTLAYMVDYSALIMYVEVFKVHYLTSAAIAFFLGAVVSYVLNVAWVFSKRSFEDMRLEMAIFALLVAAGLWLNHYCIRFFTGSVHLHYAASKFISMMIVSTANFASRKYILFR